jgi:hypothetical protein
MGFLLIGAFPYWLAHNAEVIACVTLALTLMTGAIGSTVALLQYSQLWLQSPDPNRSNTARVGIKAHPVARSSPRSPTGTSSHPARDCEHARGILASTGV